jgi:hypothetical protein
MSTQPSPRIKTSLIILICLTLFITPSAGQQVSKHKVEDKFEVGGNQSVKILKMRGEGSNEEWYVQYYRGDALESTPRWESPDLLLIAEQRVKSSKQRDATIAPESNGRDVLPGINGQAIPNSNCSFDAPASIVTSSDKFSINLAKRKIYDTYARNVNGTGVAPLKAGVTFISITEGKPYLNTVKVDPGRGAERRYDGAPVGATLYPVNSRHIVCEQYRDRIIKNLVESSYVCFINKDGNWTCPILGFPKTTSLNN